MAVGLISRPRSFIGQASIFGNFGSSGYDKSNKVLQKTNVSMSGVISQSPSPRGNAFEQVRYIDISIFSNIDIFQISKVRKILNLYLYIYIYIGMYRQYRYRQYRPFSWVSVSVLVNMADTLPILRYFLGEEL